MMTTLYCYLHYLQSNDDYTVPLLTLVTVQWRLRHTVTYILWEAVAAWRLRTALHPVATWQNTDRKSQTNLPLRSAPSLNWWVTSSPWRHRTERRHLRRAVVDPCTWRWRWTRQACRPSRCTWWRHLTSENWERPLTSQQELLLVDLQDVARQKPLGCFLGPLPSSKTTNRTVTISDYYVGCFVCLFGHNVHRDRIHVVRSFPPRFISTSAKCLWRHG